MPGHASSPYWTAVDFDSEGDDEPSPSSSHGLYLDPWDSEPCSYARTEPCDQSQGENFPSLAGEPVSASFYYVPTKNYDSEEEARDARRTPTAAEDLGAAAAAYGRRRSRQHHYEPHHDMYNGGYDILPISERRRSVYNNEDYYHNSMIYEPIYHGGPTPMLPPPGMYMPPSVARKRMSLPAPHPDYLSSLARNGKHRRPSRYADTCDRYAYESLMSEYGALGPMLGPEEWARRALPKATPGNFHLSRYGHLKIDYSCSWSSLDRLIRNK